jgi:hypothetical protein
MAHEFMYVHMQDDQNGQKIPVRKKMVKIAKNGDYNIDRFYKTPYRTKTFRINFFPQNFALISTKNNGYKYTWALMTIIQEFSESYMCI